MIYSILHFLLIVSGSLETRSTHANISVNVLSKTKDTDELYNTIKWVGDRPDSAVFYSALKGYTFLQDSLLLFERPVLTIIDFSRPSNYKRLWVVNLETKELMLQTLVAHGRNSGEVTPDRFSNTINSHQSSLGFYRTGATYMGKHGLSLKLHGFEQGINDQAERRAIVIHGADYVSEKYIAHNGRLGRSYGCPAVAMEVHTQLIKMIQNNTCLFIYYPEEEYFERSIVLKDYIQDKHFADQPGTSLNGL